MNSNTINMYAHSPLEAIASTYGLTTSDVLDMMNEQSKKQVLSTCHKYEIWQNEKNGRWVTYVPDETAPKHRRQISSKDRKGLDAKLYDIYKEEYEKERLRPITLRTLYPEWLQYKEENTKAKSQTIRRNQNDWVRYYENDDIVDVPLSHLNTRDLTAWTRQKINEYEMDSKRYGNFSLIIRQMLQYACEEMHYIGDDPFSRVKVDWDADLLKKEEKPDEELVFLEDEAPVMINYCWEQYYANRCKVQTFTPLAIVFCFYTGLRVSELSALKFSDIHRKGVVVQRMVDDKGEVVPWAKKGTRRTVPLSTSAMGIIEEVKRRRLELGLPDDEYIFAIGEPRRVYNRIKVTVKTFCRDLGWLERSIHDVRRTYVSKLIDDGVPVSTVMQYAGHKHPETTYNSYIRSIRTTNRKMEEMERALDYGNIQPLS